MSRERTEERRAIWEKFELTGAVEDYLTYKGIDWRKEPAVCASAGEEERHGTDDHSDGYRTGGLSVW